MYKIGDKVRPKGRHFAAIVYIVTDKVYNDWYQETIYTIEQIGCGKHIIDGITEDALNKDYIKIKQYDKETNKPT